jgi:hypothetical protein
MGCLQKDVCKDSYVQLSPPSYLEKQVLYVLRASVEVNQFARRVLTSAAYSSISEIALYFYILLSFMTCLQHGMREVFVHVDHSRSHWLAPVCISIDGHLHIALLPLYHYSPRYIHPLSLRTSFNHAKRPKSYTSQLSQRCFLAPFKCLL